MICSACSPAPETLFWISNSAPFSSLTAMLCSTRLRFSCHLTCSPSTFSYFPPVLFNYPPFFSRELPTQLLKNCYFGTPNPCKLTARTDACALESVLPLTTIMKKTKKELKARISLLASGRNPGEGFLGGKSAATARLMLNSKGERPHIMLSVVGWNRMLCWKIFKTCWISYWYNMNMCWGCLKHTWTWHTGTWFSGGLGCAGLKLGLDELRGLSQPKKWWFCGNPVNPMDRSISAPGHTFSLHIPLLLCPFGAGDREQGTGTGVSPVKGAAALPLSL